MFFKQYRFVFFVNFHAASTCGYAKYVFKTSLFPWGRSDQSQALNTGPKYSVIVQKDAKTWKAYERGVRLFFVSNYASRKITFKEIREEKKIVQMFGLCTLKERYMSNRESNLSINISNFVSSRRTRRYNQKIKETCMWLFWKKLYRSFTFTKDFFFFENWCRKCLA